MFSIIIVGTDHVDLPELARRDIKFGYTPDVLTAAGKYRFPSSVNDISFSFGQPPIYPSCWL
jgi:hypothetical protein